MEDWWEDALNNEWDPEDLDDDNDYDDRDLLDICYGFY